MNNLQVNLCLYIINRATVAQSV